MTERRDRDLDAILETLRPPPPSAGAILAVRRALMAEVRGAMKPEILTLPEVAQLLRLTEADLAEIIDELPAFELAGQIRMRRSRLKEWIDHRERTWRHVTSARIVDAATRSRSGKGVA